MNEFFSKLTGFDPKYAETNSAKQAEDTEDTDYSDVDFCQGNIAEEKANDGIFGFDYDFDRLEFFEDDCEDNTGFDTEG